MESITLTSKSKSALKAIKAIAKEMPNISITEKSLEDDGDSDFYYINGVRVRRGKGKLDVEKNAGSLSNIHFDDPKNIRKNAWRRKKGELIQM
jgi:hypothetical protein